MMDSFGTYQSLSNFGRKIFNYILQPALWTPLYSRASLFPNAKLLGLARCLDIIANNKGSLDELFSRMIYMKISVFDSKRLTCTCNFDVHILYLTLE